MFPRLRLATLAPALLLVLSLSGVRAEGTEIAGSIRMRHDALLNADLDDEVGDRANLTEMRTRIQFDHRVSERAKAFVQLQDSRIFGEELNTGSSLDRVDLHQAFLEVRGAFGADLALQLGRMSMSYGAQRQIGASEWSNVGRSFDGARLDYRRDDFGWLHAFAMKLRETDGGVDATSESALFGGYLHHEATDDLDLEGYLLEVYVDNGDLPDAGGSLDAIGAVYTGGARLDWNPTDGQPLKIFGEGAYQFGALPEELVDDVLRDGKDVSAYAFVAGAEWHSPGRAKTWLGVEFNLASGDEDPGDAETQTYQQLFPSGHTVLGYADRVGWRNIQSFAAKLGFSPAAQWTVWSSFHTFTLAEPADQWYGVTGAAVNSLVGHADFDPQLGNEVDLSARYAPEAALRFEAHLLFWLPGSWAEQATAFADNGGDAAAAIDEPADLEAATTIFVLTQLDF